MYEFLLIVGFGLAAWLVSRAVGSLFDALTNPLCRLLNEAIHGQKET